MKNSFTPRDLFYLNCELTIFRMCNFHLIHETSKLHLQTLKNMHKLELRKLRVISKPLNEKSYQCTAGKHWAMWGRKGWWSRGDSCGLSLCSVSLAFLQGPWSSLLPEPCSLFPRMLVCISAWGVCPGLPQGTALPLAGQEWYSMRPSIHGSQELFLTWHI